MRWTAQPWSRRRWVVLVLAVCVFAVVLWLLPLVATTSPPGLSASERAEDVGRTRTAMLALGAGVLAVIGAFLTHDNVAVAREQNELTLRSHRSDRYASGAQQLAHEEEHVRLAAVYALGALAEESEADRPAALSVLVAHAVKWGGLPAGWALAADNNRGALTTEVASREVAGVLETVATQPRPPGWSASMRDLWLCRLSLTDGSLRGLDLTGSDLRNASLVRVDLGNANLSNAMLTRALVGDATGSGTWLQGANLVDARLVNVKLEQAHLDGAFLIGAVASLDLALVSADRATFDLAHLSDLTWELGDARDASFVRTTISRGSVAEVGFARSKWFKTQVTDVEFRDCSFTAADFREVKFTRVVFVDCALTTAKIDTEGSTFVEVEMRNCELGTGAQFLERAGIRIT